MKLLRVTPNTGIDQDTLFCMIFKFDQKKFNIYEKNLFINQCLD